MEWINRQGWTLGCYRNNLSIIHAVTLRMHSERFWRTFKAFTTIKLWDGAEHYQWWWCAVLLAYSHNRFWDWWLTISWNTLKENSGTLLYCMRFCISKCVAREVQTLYKRDYTAYQKPPQRFSWWHYINNIMCIAIATCLGTDVFVPYVLN